MAVRPVRETLLLETVVLTRILHLVAYRPHNDLGLEVTRGIPCGLFMGDPVKCRHASCTENTLRHPYHHIAARQLSPRRDTELERLADLLEVG